MARLLLNVCNGLLSAFVLLTLVVMGGYAGYALWDNSQVYTAAGSAYDELLVIKEQAQDEGDAPSMLEQMQAINEDVRAWLTMDNTKIDYPLLYGETNQYYLNRNVYREFALHGSIFIDSRCDPEMRGAYTLLHGHHMANRLMFGDLDLYKDEAFFEANRTGTLILPDRIYSLRTFACLVVPANDAIIFSPDRWRDDISEPLAYARSDAALHADGEQIERLLAQNARALEAGEAPPQIVVLATCSSEYTDARTILLAEMQELPPQQDREDEEP